MVCADEPRESDSVAGVTVVCVDSDEHFRCLS